MTAYFFVRPHIGSRIINKQEVHLLIHLRALRQRTPPPPPPLINQHLLQPTVISIPSTRAKGFVKISSMHEPNTLRQQTEELRLPRINAGNVTISVLMGKKMQDISDISSCLVIHHMTDLLPS